MLICFPLAVAKQSNEELNLIKENGNLRSQLDSLQNQVELFHNESENCTSVMNSSEVEFSTIPNIEGVDKKCDADEIDKMCDQKFIYRSITYTNNNDAQKVC